MRRAIDSFSPHPLPLLAHPLPTSLQFFSHFDLRLEKERKRLLHRATVYQLLKALSPIIFCFRFNTLNGTAEAPPAEPDRYQNRVFTERLKGATSTPYPF